MGDHLDRDDWLDRLSPGGLALTGLTLFVLSFFASMLSAAAGQALFAGAIACWLAAGALWASRSLRARPVRERRLAAGIPAVLALVAGLVATGSAAQSVGLTNSAAPTPQIVQVAGATARPSAAPRGSSGTASIRPKATAKSSAPAPASPSASTGASAADSASPSPGATDVATPAPTAALPDRSALRRGPVQVDFRQLSSPVARGDAATASAVVTPGSLCSIAVVYPSGPSTAEGLGPQLSPDDGVVTWTWTVDAGAAPGIARVTVTCQSRYVTTWWTRGMIVR